MRTLLCVLLLACATRVALAQSWQGPLTGVVDPYGNQLGAAFQPNGSSATLAVSGASANVALPSGPTVVVSNTTATPAFLQLGGSGVVAVAGTGIVVPAGGAVQLTVGQNTYLAAITSTGSTTLSLAGGFGSYSQFGGSGGGSSVTWPTTGQVVVSNGSNAPTSVPYGLTGANTLVETTSGGLLTSSLIPAINLAASGAGGVTGNLPVGNLNSGTAATASTFWRGDGTWATPAGGGNVSNSGTPVNGQLAQWTSSTVVQGLATTGSGSAVLNTSPTIVTPSFTGAVNNSGNIIQTQAGVGLGSNAAIGAGLSTVTLGPSFYGAVVNTALDPATLTNAQRNNQFVAVLTPQTNSTNIWENLYSDVTVNGPGQQTVEVNAFHGTIGVNAGATIGSSESFEASLGNSGAASLYTSFLAFPNNNTSTSTVSTIVGLKGQLANQNANAGSIGEYDFLLLAPMSGTGSFPTNYFFAKNTDPNAKSMTLGPATIGTTSFAAGVSFTIKGPDTSASSWPLYITDGSNGNILIVRDSGLVQLFGAVTMASTLSVTGGVTLSGVSAGTPVSCLGLSSINLVVSAACGGSGAVSSVTNSDGTLTISPTTGAVVASLNLANANTWTGAQTIQGPGVGGETTFRVLSTAGGAAGTVFATQDNGAAEISGTLTVGTASTGPAGAVVITNSNTGTTKLITQASQTTSSIITFGTTLSSDQVALLATNETFTAAIVNFSSANVTTFNGTVKAGTSTILSSVTVPTIASGFGTSPSISAGTTTAWFQVNVGTGGTASSGVLTLPVATHGWACNPVESTANIGTTVTRAAPTGTTSVTLTSYSATTGASTPWAASDVITVSCTGG